MKWFVKGKASIALGYLNRARFAMRNFDIKDTIVVSGSPRSGTTWVANIVSNLPGYSVLFEPLHPNWFLGVDGAGFKPRTYKSPHENWLEGENYLRQVLGGKVKTTSYRLEAASSVMAGFFSSKIVAKFIRANRLLPWMSTTFTLRDMILIIRHPCAVVASQLQSGIYGYVRNKYDELPKRKDVLEEAQEIQYLDQSTLDYLEKIRTPEEILAATWCLDNLVPLSFPKPYPWILVSYEKLVREGVAQVQRIFNLLNTETPPKSIEKLRRLSHTAYDKGDYFSGENHISKWKSYLSSEQTDNILKVVTQFGFDCSSEDLEPDYDKLAGYFE